MCWGVVCVGFVCVPICVCVCARLCLYVGVLVLVQIHYLKLNRVTIT